MGWNWFLSALAQSSASLIGIIGAFLISNSHILLPFIIPEDVFFDGCYYALCVPLAGSNELLQTQTPATPLSDHDAIFELGLHFLGETPKSLFSHPLHARPVSDR